MAKCARLTDLNDRTLRVVAEYGERIVRWVCECGCSFDSEVWHCIRCGGHSQVGNSHCQNCGRKPWRKGTTCKRYYKYKG